MPGQSFKEIQDAVSIALVGITRATGQVSNDDLDFHRSADPEIDALLQKENTRLLGLVRKLTRTAVEGTEVRAPQLSDRESVDDNWKGFVDVIDNLLEKADACLDEYTGSIRKPIDTPENAPAASSTGGRRSLGRSERTQNLAKPQLLFERRLDNNDKSPFKPLLQSKPHATVILEESLVTFEAEDHTQQYLHPYETEIRRSRYPIAAFSKSDPIPYLPFKDVQATWVDTLDGVKAMLDELKEAEEIAIDLEHHDGHSYIGIVSLMQISTRKKDWIVDTLRPWRHELQVLNEVFTDPSIIKILHGSFMDMIWLQRDFGLYVVNLFDTFHAAQLLRYERRSLAYLLKRFADFDAAKQYQTADWRIRPLPVEMFNYARSDTHFLLFIYDNMRNELIDKSDLSVPDGNLVEVVMDNSKQEALQRYERPVYDFEGGSGSYGWFSMLCRTPALFNKEEFAVFRATHQWRDKIARQEDESPHQVMPKQVLFNIARTMPMDMPSLLGCSHPMSPVYRNRKDELLGIVKRAKIKGATGPEMKDVIHPLNPTSGHGASATNVPVQAHLTSTRGPQTELPRMRQGPLQLNMPISQFWGLTLQESTKYSSNSKNFDRVRLTLPLPQLSAEIFEEPRQQERSDSSAVIPGDNPGALAQHQYIKNRPPPTSTPVSAPGSDEVFTLKEKGGSRKRKAREPIEKPSHQTSGNIETVTDIESTAATNGEQDIIGLDQPDSETSSEQGSSQRKRAKQERKVERRRKKLEKRAQSQRDGNGNGNGTSNRPLATNSDGPKTVQPFDYANAPSVLFPPKNQGGQGAARGGKGGVNPYAKSLNAPKGVKRARREEAGKSFTFQK